MSEGFKLEKLDFDKLYDEAEAAEHYGICPNCEFDGDTDEKLLCWCGVCFKYCHDNNFHELIDADPMSP